MGFEGVLLIVQTRLRLVGVPETSARPRRRCPDCGNEHFAHLGHWCARTGKTWRPGDDERAVAESARVEAERVAALKPRSRRGRPKRGAEVDALERRKPWEAMGISRRTWYYRLARGEVARFDDEL